MASNVSLLPRNMRPASSRQRLRDLATGFVTGPAGRLSAFVLDLAIASGRYLVSAGVGQERLVTPAAFVTGGSGFIGGRLIERLRSDGWDVRALARSAASAEKVRALGAEPVHGDLDDRRRHARRRRGLRRPLSTPPPTSASGARARSSSASTSMAPQRAAGNPRGGRAALRPRRHRGRPAGGTAARERRRERSPASRLQGALSGHQGDGRAGGARRQRATASRPWSCDRAWSGVAETPRSCPG